MGKHSLKLGRFLGKEWSTRHDITGTNIPVTRQFENVELMTKDKLSELFLELTFVATNNVDFDILLNDDKLFDTYLSDSIGLESAFIDNFDNLILLLTFLFKTNITLTESTANLNKQVYDLTEYKDNCISIEELDEKYQEWIKISERENSMDEYGNLIGIVGYIQRNLSKKNLILMTEKRKHCA